MEIQLVEFRLYNNITINIYLVIILGEFNAKVLVTMTCHCEML